MSMTPTEASNLAGVSQNALLAFINQKLAMEKEIKSLKGKIAARTKAFKNEGGDVKTVERILELQKMSVEEIAEEQNKLVAYAEMLKMPAAEQMNRYAELNMAKMSKEQREDRWYRDGFMSSMRGDNRSLCQHDPNSDGGRKWLEGYEDCQLELLAGIKQLQDKEFDEAAPGSGDQGATPETKQPDAPAAEPAKRGRPAGKGKGGAVVDMKSAKEARAAERAAKAAGTNVKAAADRAEATSKANGGASAVPPPRDDDPPAIEGEQQKVEPKTADAPPPLDA